MSIQLPKLMFVGAGNIAQSIMKGILKANPGAASQIVATAPTMKNLALVETQLGCRTTLLADAQKCLVEFSPDYLFLCVKPQVLQKSISDESKKDMLARLIQSVPDNCMTLSLLAGIKSETFSKSFAIHPRKIARVMLNTAAELGCSSVLYHTQPDLDQRTIEELECMFGLVGESVVRLGDENLMDVATGLCGSGIALFYEMIQSISDIGVKNGLSRTDATLVAAQLSKAAGEMLIRKNLHPYQLRDSVTSPAGTTIYGLDAWHQNSTGHKIGQAVQASIDRAQALSSINAKRN